MSLSLDTIRLLVAHDSQDDAEQLINKLRNAGFASRAELVLDEAQLVQALKAGSWEVFLCSERFGDCDYVQALAHLKHLGKSPRMLVLTASFDADRLCAVLAAGAQGIAPSSHPELLLLLVEQQLGSIRQRRIMQQTQLDLHAAEKRVAALLDQSQNAIAYVVDGMHIHANDTYLKLFGYPGVDELAGVPVMDLVAEESLADIKQLLRNRYKDDTQPHELAARGRHQDGHEFDATFVFSTSSFDNESCTQVVIRAASGVDEATLRQLAQTDATTGLPNRSWLLSELDQALERSIGQGQLNAVFYVRMDDFENLQSQLGISATDQLLQQLGEALQQHAGELPLARIGGADFAIIEALTDQDVAQQQAEALRNLVEQLMPEVGARTLKITASIGVAFVREDSSNSKAVLTRSLECCNRAGASNTGNAVLVHNPLDDVEAGSEEAIAILLKRAIELQSLELSYQSILNLNNENERYFEVFVKLPQTDGSHLDASAFMPVAAKHGLAAKIDRWVALSAMKQAASQSQPTRLLINISGYSLADKAFGGWLVGAINATKLTPANITFQINEGDAVNFLKQVAIFAKGLNKAGCHFSISRFGGTINPLKLFDQVPAQQVKFEGSFTHDLDNTEQRAKFAELIEQTAALDKEVLVGFVESASQMQQLWSLGHINYLQGFYLAQPEAQLPSDSA